MSTEILSLQEYPLRLVWRTDVHLADTSPISRLDDWAETIFDKLRQVGKIAWEVQAQAVIDGGDFFHVKSPVRTSHRLVRRVMELHANYYPCPVYGNVGNHDCAHAHLRWLPQQPLGVLFEAGTFLPLYNEHEAIFESNGVKVRVVGIPYHGKKYEKERFNLVKGDEDYLVLTAHVLASEKTSTMFEGEDIIPYSSFREMKADVFLLGHWHKDQGITEVSDGKWVVNVGSLTRGSLSCDHLDRSPACVVLAFGKEGLKIERRDLRVKPSAEIFDIKGRVRVETQKMTLDKFEQSIRKALLLSNPIMSLEDMIRGMQNIPESVREKAQLILEEARI